jgi:hypothetical protein
MNTKTKVKIISLSRETVTVFQSEILGMWMDMFQGMTNVHMQS